ncbi:hypothetical protein LZ519_00950 [Sphingomonas sp. RG327]|jgi:hypothetical protein|uniref:Uncharacterized protein n=1 Tax=Sphingomonas anseongensis TaxID=2908207 RepID=A0ABT0RCB1_9SPHN|nr:hypothetical protein [Sphingomonas anseongensis]MCL6677892.1 hypothetical protein [Sphingomonas anseongensis]
MISLLMALMLSPADSIGDSRFILRDPLQGATPVTDKDLRPARQPYCRTEADVQRAVAQVRNGEPGDCFVKDAAAFNRRR